jgi:hypothetical protein
LTFLPSRGEVISVFCIRLARTKKMVAEGEGAGREIFPLRWAAMTHCYGQDMWANAR